MRQVRVHLRSTSPYRQSKYILEKKKRNELDQDFEERVWRQRMHVNSDGYMIIPAQHFKASFHLGASYKTEKIPGQGQRTFTKHLQSGVRVSDPLVLPYKADDVEGEWVMSGAQGAGSKTQVPKCFPTIEKWDGEVVYYVLDDIVTPEIFEITLRQAGMFIGIGSYRPSAPAHGHYGCYIPTSIAWEVMDESMLF